MLKACLLVLYYCTIFSPNVLGLPKRKEIGGLFENSISREAFKLSLNAINKLRYVPTQELSHVFFADNSQILQTRDIFETAEIVQSMMGRKMVAIFGPSDKLLAEHVQSICESRDMLNIVARLNFKSTRLMSFNLYPDSEELASIFAQMVIDFKWKQFTILYDTSENLIIANRLLKRWQNIEYTITLRQLGKGPNYREVLRQIKESKNMNIVIDCSFEILEDVLIQSQQVGILGEDYEVIVTSLDLHTLDLEPYQYSGVNFTGIRLVDVDNPYAQYIFEEYMNDGIYFDRLDKLRVEPALIFDSVPLFSRAYKSVEHVVNVSVDWWGQTLINDMASNAARGLTGLVVLDPDGARRQFEVDVLQLTPKGTKKVGKYNSTFGFHWKFEDTSSTVMNKTYKILISLVAPYNMLKDSAKTEYGNDRYEGFAIDIIEKLSQIMHFNYTFIETDLGPGKEEENGEWSGMLGLIAAGEADLAITDLTITADRERVVDFSLPFLNLGISILYTKPKPALPTLFSFLSPFRSEIWLYLCGSFVLVSMCHFIIGRSCPAEWINPYPCIQEPEYLENQFTLKNSFWFTLGSIMQQGSEVAPIGLSTRMLASVWYFFCLIIVALYTANLATFLILELPAPTIKSVDDLASQAFNVKYGAKRGGATFNYFKQSEAEPYKTMYKYMVDNDKEVMTDSNDEGMKKVQEGNYAFLMESSTIEYFTKRNCEFQMVGPLLDDKGYGIAMRKNTTRHLFNQAVLTLQENSELTNLKTEWWERKGNAKDCKADKDDSGPAPALTLANVGGVFLTLGVGIVISIFFALCEFYWAMRMNVKKKDVLFKDEFKREMKFLIKCKGTMKTSAGEKASGQTTETNTRASTPPYEMLPTIVAN